MGTIAVFALDGELPELVAEVDTGGEWPRHFALIGEHLYVADERADMVRVFRVDPGTGVPAPVGRAGAGAEPDLRAAVSDTSTGETRGRRWLDDTVAA